MTKDYLWACQTVGFCPCEDDSNLSHTHTPFLNPPRPPWPFKPIV